MSFHPYEEQAKELLALMGKMELHLTWRETANRVLREALQAAWEAGYWQGQKEQEKDEA